MHVDIHDNAERDLDALWQTDARAAATVTIVLEALQDDPSLANDLGHHGDGHIGAHLVNVKRWQEAKAKSAPLWRFRILNTPATSYRVVYAFSLVTRQISVLAVVHKDDFDYQINSDLGRRIMADWRAT